MSLDISKRALRSEGFTVSVNNTFFKASEMADNWARTSGAKTFPAGRGALPKNYTRKLKEAWTKSQDFDLP